LRRVLAEEIVLGRVRLARDGGYALIVSSLPRDVLAAVAGLSTLRPTGDDRPTPVGIDVAELVKDVA